jgi:16S rRNA (guanine527-N7)-methyltransferase
VNRELLVKSVKGLDLELTAQQFDACEILLQELLRWNKKIDSLYLVPEFKPGDRVLDIGSGAGFPALVLAIARPDCLVTSIDAVGKKISFQKHISRLLKLTNLVALHGRVEVLAVERSAEFNLVASRAFSSLSQFLSLAAPLPSVGGRLISMRGSNGEQEASQLLDEVTAAGFVVEPAVSYCLPMKMGERSLVIMRKVR